MTEVPDAGSTSIDTTGNGHITDIPASGPATFESYRQPDILDWGERDWVRYREHKRQYLRNALLLTIVVVIFGFGALLGLFLILGRRHSYHPLTGSLVIAGSFAIALLLYLGGHLYLTTRRGSATSGDPDLRQELAVQTDSDIAERDRIQASLREYQKQTQRQARSSYRIAESAIAIGFGVLVGGAVLALNSSDTTAQVVVGGLAATGSAMSGYVAATAIRMYNSAQAQMNLYYAQPLVQGWILQASSLATKLNGDGRDRALERIIEQTLEGASVAGYLITGASPGPATSRFRLRVRDHSGQDPKTAGK